MAGVCVYLHGSILAQARACVWRVGACVHVCTCIHMGVWVCVHVLHSCWPPVLVVNVMILFEWWGWHNMLPFRVAHSGRPFCGDGNALCVLSSRNYWLCVYCETQELEFSLPHVAMATYCVIPCSFKIACSKFLYSQRSTFGTKSLPHNWPGICSPPHAIVTIWKNSKGGP